MSIYLSNYTDPDPNLQSKPLVQQKNAQDILDDNVWIRKQNKYWKIQK